VHALYEQAATSLQEAGFPRHEVLAAITAVESFVLGSALDLAAPPVMVSGIDADATPRLAEAAAATPSGRARADQAFHLGLDALIVGLRHQLTPAVIRAGRLDPSGMQLGLGGRAAHVQEAEDG
jgi:hypothetical protein